MEVTEVLDLLDNPEKTRDRLAGWRLAHPAAAHANLVALAQSGVTLDLLTSLYRKLSTYLPQAEDADRLLAELRRYFESARSPLSLASLLERDESAARMLLQVLDLGRPWADVLVADPEAFDLLRLTEGQPGDTNKLTAEIQQEVTSLADEADLQSALARIRRREWLRIAYGQVFCQVSSEIAGEELAAAAEALLQAALLAAERKQQEQGGSPPHNLAGEPAGLGILGLSRLGGRALDYHAALEVMFLSDAATRLEPSRPGVGSDYFERIARHAVQLLQAESAAPAAFRLSPHILPGEGPHQLVTPVDQALYYYDVLGRTWQRREFLSARRVAGNRSLCESFLHSLESWLYRRYLHRADETGIKALQRRLLKRLQRDADEPLSAAVVSRAAVLIEDVIQFLQLLSGGELSEIHSGQTLVALQALGKAGVLDPDETAALDRAYRTFRSVEQLVEILAGPEPTPEQEVAWKRVEHWALRSGLAARDSSLADLLGEQRLNLGQVVKRLLGGMFQNEPPVMPVTDLILEPDPQHANPDEVLGPLGFQQPEEAYGNLQALATEKIPYLSTRRCRHFLASIAPQLVEAIAATPAPDATLSELSRVSESLGGKGVLWELFSFHRPSLELYVRLCGASPYLASILTSNPGMIDELLDSLQLDQLRELSQLQAVLDNLCRGASETLPILVGFKQSQHLRIGIRDLLGKDDITATHRALAEVAEACLARIASEQQSRLVAKFGGPFAGESDVSAAPCELLMLGLGKLGGQEPNYHSDLEAIFIYESEGQTRLPERTRRGNTTTNAHFFNQLAQKIVSAVNQLGPQGRLYELGTNLRPHGKLGPLAVSWEEFFRFLASPECRLAQWQALLKARPITGSSAARARFSAQFHETLAQLPLADGWQAELYAARRQSEGGAADRNLKRAPGGTLDIECIVQTLQLENRHRQSVLVPGTLAAINELRRANVLAAVEASYLQESYQYLRRMESAIRLMNRVARHDLPEDAAGQGRLAMLLREPSAERMLAACEHYRRENRQLFERFFGHRGVTA
jgi:glutamate-ammonia-ligase adenylyltransferase